VQINATAMTVSAGTMIPTVKEMVARAAKLDTTPLNVLSVQPLPDPMLLATPEGLYQTWKALVAPAVCILTKKD
jgi:hypothetical protein